MSKEYELAIKIAGEVEKSFYNSTKLTKKELADIARSAAQNSGAVKKSFGDNLKSLDGTFGAIEKGAKKAFSFVATSALAATTAIAGIATASISVGAPFEEQMSVVKSISKASSPDMAMLTEKAKEMGATTSFSATEAGKALEYMAMAGWKASAMTKSLEGVMYAAAASGEDLGLVADIITDGMTAFKMSAEGTTNGIANATHFANVLAAAASSTNTNIAMLGESFKYAAPIAGALGYSIEDTSIALGLMANTGIKASMAGTTLRSTLTNLVNPSDKMRSQMDLLGISATNADGSMKSLKELMDHLRDKMGGMTSGQQEQVAAMLDGRDATQAAAEAMEGLSAEEIKHDTALGIGKDLVKDYTAAQLNSAIVRSHGKKAVKEMTEEEKRNAIALEQGLVQLEGLTEAEQAAASARIFGKTAMSGMLSILNASEKDYKKLTKAIYNSKGAAKQMADVRLDNLNGDVTILKSAMEGLGIQIYEGLSEPLRDVVQWITGLVTALSTKIKNSNMIAKLVESFKKTLPTVIRHVKNFTTAFLKFIDPVLELGGWLLKNPEVIVGLLAGIGTALVTYKVVSGIVNLTGAMKSFFAVMKGNPVSVILGVVGAIAGIATAISAANASAKRQNLAEHFGDISLSMEELSDVAAHILQVDNLGKLRESMQALSDLEGIQTSIIQALDQINKLNWKVSIGMKLNKGERRAYKASIKEYINDAQTWVEQKQYAVTLSIQVLQGDKDLKNNNIINTINNFYAGKKQELADLGAELSAYITDAFSDKLLSFDEVEKIMELQGKMAKIQAALAGSKFEAELKLLELKFAGGELDAETFQNLQAEIFKQIEAAKLEYDGALTASIQEVDMVLDAGAIDANEYNAQVTELSQAYLGKVGNLEVRAVSFQTDTIVSQYDSELAKALPKFKEVTDTAMAEFSKYIEEGGEGNPMNWNLLFQDLQNFDGLDSTTKAAMQQLFDELKPSVDKLKETAEQYREAGKNVPANIQKGLNDAALLGAVSGDVDAIWDLIGGTISNSAEYRKALAEIQKSGGYIPEELGKGILLNKESLYKPLGAIYDYFKTNLQKLFDRSIYVTTNVTVGAKIKTNAELIPKLGGVANRMGVAAYATGGLIKHPTLATFAEDYPEMAIPINNSKRSVDLWRTTGRMLGLYKKEPDGVPVFDVGGDGITSLTEKVVNVKSDRDNTGGVGTVTYSPVFNFYGQAPKEEDLVSAGRQMQDEFDRMWDKKLQQIKRLSF